MKYFLSLDEATPEEAEVYQTYLKKLSDQEKEIDALAAKKAYAHVLQYGQALERSGSWIGHSGIGDRGSQRTSPPRVAREAGDSVRGLAAGTHRW